jgi:hypothetical protein
MGLSIELLISNLFLKFIKLSIVGPKNIIKYFLFYDIRH